MATISGNAKSNTLIGTSGPDLINGFDGDDLIEGLAGGDEMYGGAGTDTLSYLSSNFGVQVTLGAAGSLSFAGFGHASLDVGNGFENLIGSAFDDVLTGNSGPNVIEGRGGADLLEGGLGVDTLSYASSPSAVFVSLSGGASLPHGGDAEGDEVTGFENLIGSAFADLLIGDEFANVIHGGSGADLIGGGGENDLLYGEASGDTFLGDPGADRIYGGKGNDIVQYDDSLAGVAISLKKNGKESSGSGGDAAGDRLKKVEDLVGSEFNDSLGGNNLKNYLNGDRGNDRIRGKDGNDWVRGGDGDDVVSGGAGKDKVYGDSGLDILIGGAGADSFWFSSRGETNLDRIKDYVSGEDRIVLDKEEFGSLSLGRLKAGAFQVGSKAADASDRIVHDRKSGLIYYDADGTGVVEQAVFAKVTPGLKLTNADFLIVEG